MNPRSIPLQDVHHALMFAKVKLVARTDTAGRPLARVAAYTQAPTWEPACRDQLRARRLGVQPRRALPQHFSPMDAGDLGRVLERTRFDHGLAEVRRTWGAGMRALQAEFRGGAMR